MTGAAIQSTGDIKARIADAGLTCAELAEAKSHESGRRYVPQDTPGEWIYCEIKGLARFTGGGWAMVVGFIGDDADAFWNKICAFPPAPSGQREPTLVTDGSRVVASAAVVTGGDPWSPDLPPQRLAEILGAMVTTAPEFCAQR